MTPERPKGERTGAFIVTREHRRFTEFAEAVRKHRSIGVCHGPAGVGKTLSARRHARWDAAEPLLADWGRPADRPTVYAALARARSAFYTPSVGVTLRELKQDLPRLLARTDRLIDEHLQGEDALIARRRVELMIVDEAERLSMPTLEYLRDLYDREGIGVILIGMPGIEIRLSRYPQLFSRVGFAHAYRPLRSEELTFVLIRRWRQLGLDLDEADFTDAQAVAAIVRITGGNFRLVHRLFVQIARVMRINELNVVTEDVVEAARSVLVIGAT